MKKSSCRFISAIACFTLLSTTAVPAFAADISDVSNDNFFFQDIEAEIEKANAKPIVADKGSNGSSRGVLGSYSDRKGVILATPINDSASGLKIVGHAAIVFDVDYTFESLLLDGVTIGLNDWDEKKAICYQMGVNETTEEQDAAVGDWCASKFLCPYNGYFTNIDRRDAFYCSQLVWAGYKDVCGVDLNTDDYGIIIAPMEFVYGPKTGVIYSKTK